MLEKRSELAKLILTAKLLITKTLNSRIITTTSSKKRHFILFLKVEDNAALKKNIL